MRRLSWLAPVLVAAAICSVGTATGGPLVTAYRPPQPPVVDGVLNDPGWQTATLCRPFLPADGEKLEAQNQVRLCWDDGHLYVALECFEPYLAPLLQQADRVRALQQGHDSNVFSDDCVEIFLDIPGRGLFQFAANSIGTRWDARDGDVSWNCDWQARAVRLADRYVVECAIPLSALGVAGLAGREWAGNFCRERTATPELSTWSGLRGAFNDRTQYGIIRFADSGAAVRQFDISTVSQTRWGISAEVLTSDASAALQAVLSLRAEDKPVPGLTMPLQREASGVARAQRDFALPPEALAAGKVSYEWSVRAGDKLVYSSPPFNLTLGANRAVFLLTQGPGVRCEAFVNGKPLAAGEFDLQAGLNVISLVASGPAGWVKPELTCGSQRLPADERWYCSTAEPPEGWQTAASVPGFTPAARSGQGLWCESATAEKVYFRRGLFVSPPTPRLFPATDKAWLPAGTRQRLKVYLTSARELLGEDYSLYLRVPSYLSLVASDGIDGVKPTAVDKVAGEGGARETVYRVTYRPYPGTGMELSLRWARADGALEAYQPAFRAGGTFDWSHFKTVVRAPATAALLHPLVIKWQDQQVTGTFWTDNITIRKQGTEENLLKAGDFEGPEWSHPYLVPNEGVGGSRCLRILSTPANANQQQAVWVPKDPPLRVEPGAQYVVEMDIRAEKLGTPVSKPMASLLFALDPKTAPGKSRLWANFEVAGGNVTEVAQPVEIEVLPPLLNVRPRQIRITPCYYGDQLSDPSMLDALADNVWRSGITANYGGAGNELVRLLRKKGAFSSVLSLSYTPWTVPATMRELLKERPEVRAREYPDKASEARMCPTWVLSEGQEVLAAVEQQMANAVKGGLYQGADWDFEDPVIDPPTYCFCPRCLEAFRKEAALPADATLTPVMMTGEHRQAWTAFRCRQNAVLASHIRKGVKAGSPETEFSMYSGYQGRYTQEHYGADWSLFAPLLDEAVAGYNGDRAAIQGTIAALGDVPFMGGEMYYLSPQTESGAAPDPRTWRNRLLRQCVESGGLGVLIWYLPTMDGGAFYYTSEAAAVLARYETLIHDGERCDREVKVEGLPANDWFALKHGRDRLVLLLNFANRPLTAKLSTPTRWQAITVVDPVSGRLVPNADNRARAVEVPPFGVRAITAREP